MKRRPNSLSYRAVLFQEGDLGLGSKLLKSPGLLLSFRFLGKTFDRQRMHGSIFLAVHRAGNRGLHSHLMIGPGLNGIVFRTLEARSLEPNMDDMSSR